MTTRRQILVGGGATLVLGAVGVPLTAKAQEKKTVVLASMGPLTGNFDPTSHTTIGQGNFDKLVFSHLTRARMEEGKTEVLEPDLATSWEIIDQSTLEFKLREGVKFHDGQDFTAEDVKATFDYASQPDRPASSFYPGKVDVEVVDPLTVRISTEKYGYPASAFWFVSSYLPILCAADIQDPAKMQSRPNGTNGFKYVMTEGDRSTLEAFENYYDGRPKIDQIVYAYVPDANTRVLGLMNGEYQIAERLEPEQYESLLTNDTVAVRKGLSTENKYLHFRCNKAPFDDPRIRMAACHAIDREQILSLMGDAGVASNCFVSPMKFGYADVPNYPTYDPAESARLLEEAGFPAGQGLPQLEYITSIGFYPKTKEYGELITAMLMEVGFDVQLTVLEPAAWEQAIYRGADGQGPGHMCDVGWMTGSPEPDLVLRPNWHSSAALINGVSDPEIDAALDKERAIIDPTERARVLAEELFPLLAAKVPSFSLFSAVVFHGAAKNLEGAYYFPSGPIDFTKADLI